jgi:hypothetical protein
MTKARLCKQSVMNTKNVQCCSRPPPAHSATCNARAAARSERGQLAWIHADTVFWNRLLVQMQDISVLSFGSPTSRFAIHV